MKLSCSLTLIEAFGMVLDVQSWVMGGPMVDIEV